MKNLLLVFALVLGLAGFSQAQDYKSAVGLRFGYPLSVTYKTFLNETNAVEVFGGFRGFAGYTEFRINAAYQIHAALDDVEGLQWYYGAGPGLAFYSFDSAALDGGMSITLSGYLGLQYTLEETPVSFSVDWVPSLYIGGFGAGFGAGYGAFSARYVLN